MSIASGNPPGGRMGMVAEVVEEAEEKAEVVRNLREDPFMNDLILDKVFSYCSRGMISDCRLVNRKWYTASLPIWNRSNSVMKLQCRRKPGGGDGVDHWNWGYWKWNGYRYMSDFVELSGWDRDDPMSSGEINGMLQYKKFDLRLDDSFRSPEIRLNEFWDGTGPWITSLKLTYDGPFERDFVRDLFYCHYTPNLTELDICIRLSTVDLSYSSDGEDDDDEDAVATREVAQRGSVQRLEERSIINSLKSLKISGDLDPYPFEWKDYLGCCPKLENLQLTISSRCLKFQLQSIVAAIKDIRAENKKNLRLKSLGWCDVIGNGMYSRMFSSAVPQLLKEAQLDRLQSFSVYFSQDAPNELLHEMCTMHSKSLQKLTFYRNNGPFPLLVSPFLGVPMTHLTSLVAEGKAFGNLLFLREVPALRSLKLVQCRGDREFHETPVNTIISATNRKDMDGVSLSSLTSFHCDYPGDFEPMSRDLSTLRGWMPALLRMELQLNSETFPTVCELWPNLEHVTILGGRIGDRGLVGLRYWNGVPHFGHAHITILQELQSFEVKAPYGPRTRFQGGDGKLTAYSVLHGLRHLPRLEKVKINPKATPNDIEIIEACIRQWMPQVNFET